MFSLKSLYSLYKTNYAQNCQSIDGLKVDEAIQTKYM